MGLAVAVPAVMSEVQDEVLGPRFVGLVLGRRNEVVAAERPLDEVLVGVVLFLGTTACAATSDGVLALAFGHDLVSLPTILPGVCHRMVEV